jgi:hypothetical protein
MNDQRFRNREATSAATHEVVSKTHDDGSGVDTLAVAMGRGSGSPPVVGGVDEGGSGGMKKLGGSLEPGGSTSLTKLDGVGTGGVID